MEILACLFILIIVWILEASLGLIGIIFRGIGLGFQIIFREIAAFFKALFKSRPKSKANKYSYTTQAKPKQPEINFFDNAVQTAVNYCNSCHMSRARLLNQLIDVERFSESEANYAVENINVDYNIQAIFSAISYCRSCYLSKERLERQLIEQEKYTAEQAKFAVNNIIVDYNELAKMNGRSYAKSCHMSKDRIYDQLITIENFTESEAKYAVEHINNPTEPAEAKSKVIIETKVTPKKTNKNTTFKLSNQPSFPQTTTTKARKPITTPRETIDFEEDELAWIDELDLIDDIFDDY